MKSLKPLGTLTPKAIAVIAALPAQTLAADDRRWPQEMERLQAAFAIECQSQQKSGEVNLSRVSTLAQINNQIEAVLNAAQIDVVRINNGQRFYVTDQVYKLGNEVDLVINDRVAIRFPTCSRSSEFMTN